MLVTSKKSSSHIVMVVAAAVARIKRRSGVGLMPDLGVAATATVERIKEGLGVGFAASLGVTGVAGTVAAVLGSRTGTGSACERHFLVDDVGRPKQTRQFSCLANIRRAVSSSCLNVFAGFAFAHIVLKGGSRICVIRVERPVKDLLKEGVDVFYKERSVCFILNSQVKGEVRRING